MQKADVVRDTVLEPGTHVTESNSFPITLKIRATTDHDVWSEVP